MIRQHIDSYVERSMSGQLLSLGSLYKSRKNSKVPAEEVICATSFPSQLLKVPYFCLNSVRFILFKL